MDNSRPFEQIGKKVDSSLATIALAISGIGLVFIIDLVKIVPDETYHLALRCCVILVCLIIVACHFYGTILTNRRSARVELLEDENASLKRTILQTDSDHRDHCSKHLKRIGDLVSFRGSDRVSLYKFDSNKFVMLGRHSERPELKERGRGVYPADEGVIGIAWASIGGRCFVDNLPDPDQDLEAYKKANREKFNFPEYLVDIVSMKSRTIGAYTLKDRNHGGRVAIILFESIERKRFVDDELYDIVEGQAGDDLALLLEVIKPQEPSLSVATKRGL